MTASSAGGGAPPSATGLDISLAALRRQDPYINNIVDVASQVALYTFNNRTNEWVSVEPRSSVSLAPLRRAFSLRRGAGPALRRYPGLPQLHFRF